MTPIGCRSCLRTHPYVTHIRFKTPEDYHFIGRSHATCPIDRRQDCFQNTHCVTIGAVIVPAEFRRIQA